MAGKKLLYEISARSWIRRFGGKNSLADVPQTYWQRFADQGFDYIWLMGVWETTSRSIEEHCFHPDLTKRYSTANPAWSPQDVWGSPYAIDDYVLHHALGKMEDLEKLHQDIRRTGMKLILDFVPNHFNAYSSLIEKNADCFVRGSREQLARDPQTYFQSKGHIFAHGKDPYFPAWSDTIQVNYRSSAAHELMLDRLDHISKFCDGVRCDMAMLVLPRIFDTTWPEVEKTEETNFWEKAISTTKQKEDFEFIAESYWDLEEELQNLGFDFTYDKKTLDLVLENDHKGLDWHIGKGKKWHDRSVKFIENHDEDRSLTTLGLERSRAAAVMTATLPGMMLVFDGQVEGFRQRVPVQLALDSFEIGCPCNVVSNSKEACSCQSLFYKSLLSTLQHPAFKGNWSSVSNHTEGVYVWTWTNNQDQVAVFINYSEKVKRIKFPKMLETYDLLNKIQDPRYLQIHADHVELLFPPYRAGIFEIKT